METIIIGGVLVAVVIAIAIRIRQYRLEVEQEQQEVMEAVVRLSQEYSEGYSLTDVDEILKNAAVKCLNRECPHGLAERLSQYTTHDERKDSVEKLVYQLADSMGVELEGVDISDDMPDNVLGLYHEQGYLCINAVVMEADPERVLMTITHELRHGVQYQACLKNRDIWGFSTQTKAIWYYNITHYIDEPFEIYENQPVEYDANYFANEVIQSYNSRRR